jgi:hypothetical protein
MMMVMIVIIFIDADNQSLMRPFPPLQGLASGFLVAASSVVLVPCGLLHNSR